MWGHFTELLKKKGLDFSAVNATSDRKGFLASLGISDPIEMAVIETTWVKKTSAEVCPPGGGDKALVAHFERAEKREVEPWRIQAERFETRRNAWHAEDQKNLQKAFLDLAKAGGLTQIEILLGSYCLYGNDDALKFLAALIVREQPCDRIRSHNFLVGSLMGSDFMLQYGDLLENLSVPLYPPQDAFSALNTQLLRTARSEHQRGVTGGHAPRATLGDIFGATISDPSGAGLPVVQGQNGWEVDTTPIESAFNEVYNQLAVLTREIKALKEGEKLTETLAELRQRVGRTRTSFRNLIPSATNTYGQQRGSNGYRGGRGRGFRGGRGPN